ncbi:uncharacterized protein LOC113296467 [Papaver somniferum]|uniref:uncharacterized protein LOC113296467 n=1 Tax=Papaver somniferum TaxID=3469 RepID=UPI000E6F5E73|nr:uncharacterized protein LOC113296467 [Papaver somniferum]
MEKFEGWSYKVGVRGTSDHGALLGIVVNISKPVNTPFKYQPVWSSHPDFLELIRVSWGEVVAGNPTFSFLFKLKRLKQVIRKWNWEIFGDLRLKVSTTEQEVMSTSLQSDKLVTARGKHEVAAQQYNELIRAKSRVKWVKEGGANTAFFHANIRIRKAQNNINELEDENGYVVTDQATIADILIKHFERKFEHKEMLPSHMDIKVVVFGMDANSAPGPDGFPGSFYKYAWEILKDYLTEDIKCCWSHGFISKGMNSNFLVLLPKIQGAKKAEQFRPIGLANFNFKIITRIITTRLSKMIENMISMQQGAFIKGRNIQDRIVLASEMINELNIKRRGGNVGMKLDITQAYDSLIWNFLFEVLRRFGFSEIGIHWLRRLFESARISVLVNGSPCGFFGVGRGLRQGDPLSPILFILDEEVLSRNVTSMVQDGRLQAMVNRGGRQPSHLMFADDIFIFCNGNKRSLDNLMVMLGKYQSSSGQVVNIAKSKCFVGGVTDTRKNEIANYLHMDLSAFPDNMPVYNMSVYNWPKSVIKECEKIIRNFLWSADPAVKKLVTAKWDEVNSPISEGGMGLRRLEIMNKALLMKLLWKIETKDVEWT